MLKTVLAAASIGLAALTFTAPSNAMPLPGAPAAASGLSQVRFRGFRRGVLGGGPVYYYRSGGCAWLRHRALVTGSPYWWHRYRLCRRGW